MKKSEKNRIIVFTDTFPKITETFILDQITGFLDRGIDVEIWTMVSESKKKFHPDVNKYDLLSNIKVIKIPAEKFQKPEMWCEKFYDLNDVTNLNYIENIHIHFGPNFLRLAPLFFVHLKVRVVVSFHGYDAAKFINEYGSDIYKYLFERVDLITTPSNFMKNKLISIGCKENKIAIHRYGIKLSLFKNNYSVSKSKKLKLLTVSRLVSKKGIEFSIKALAEIKNEFDFQYDIVGEGPLYGSISELIRELKLENKVKISPFKDRDSILQMMSKADIYILNSITSTDGDQEGIPVSLIEAQAMKLPVVSSFHAGIPELVEHNKTGLLSEEKNVKQLKENINSLVKNPELRKQFSDNARKKVEREFNIETLNDKLLGYFNFELKNNNNAIKDSSISICIPTFNRADYLKEAIQSILIQNCENIEIVIIDDGSTDHTKEVVDSFNSEKINYTRIEHCGAPVARNKAVENAKGDYILWLDSDDVLEENTINLYLDKLKSCPDADVIYGDLIITDSLLNPQKRIEFEDWNGRNDKLISQLFWQSPLPHPAVLIKKELYNKFGNYDNSFKRAHDYEWWTRAASIAKFVKIDSVVCKWRWHSSNMSSGSVEIDTSYDELVIRKLLEKFDLKKIFPTLDWSNSNEKVRAAAYLNIAKRFLEIKRYVASLEYAEKSYKLNPDKQIAGLIKQLKERINNSLENKSELKVLFVVHNFPPNWFAGVENYTYSLTRSLIQKGVNVTVLYPQFRNNLKSSFIEDEIYKEIKIKRLILSNDLNPVNQIIREDAEQLFKQILLKYKYDIIHFHHLMGMPFSFVKIAKKSGAGIVFTLHDFYTICPRIHLFKEEDNTLCSGPDNLAKCLQCMSGNLSGKDKKNIEKYLALREKVANEIFYLADLVISPSKYLAGKYKSFNYRNDVKIFPFGLEPVKRKNVPERSQTVYGFIGAINKLKNIDFLIDTFKNHKGDLLLNIYGDGLKGIISNLKEKINEDRRISYKGAYKPEDLPEILSEIDIIIVPSLNENYPLVVREALSAGIPVIASKVGGIPEIVVNNVNGYLFNSNNKVELSNIIKKIEKNPSLIDKLKKGIKPVKSIKQESEELISEYKNLTENKQTNVSIIIPVFNNVEFTKKCLKSLYLNTDVNLNYEIIIIDNGSTDGTKEFLNEQKALHKNLNVLINKKNEGFAKANNLAVSKSKGSNLVFLNNDTEVKKGWLENLLTIIENDPKVGAVGSKLLYPDGTIQHAGVIIIENPFETNPLVASHVFVNQPSDFPQANELRNYQALTAACLLVNKNIFIQAGSFDEDFWNGYEDVDLCFKINELGYKIVYQPLSIVIHHESKSGPERFSKVANNVQLLNKKWSGKIKADFKFDQNKQLLPLNSDKIQNYKYEYRDYKKVSIITLTYNQLQFTKSFIQSLYQNTNHPFELVIVDNNSNDDTINFLKKLEKTKNNVKLILNKNNLGFPKGVNQGIKKAAGHYILIANNDIVVTKGWLERMIEIAESDPKIGLIGPLSNAVSGMQLDEDAKYGTISEMHNYAAELKQNNNGRFLEFPRVAFLCTLIKKEVIEKIGGLDERFSPGNFEDDDFCLRAQLAGFKTVIAKDVFIHHYGSKSFTADGMEKYKARLEGNQIIFVDKWGATPEEIWLQGKQIKGRNIMFTLDKNEFTENLQRALSLIEEKDYEVALDYLKNSVEQYNNFDHDESDPELTNLLNLAGNVSLLNGNHETAQKYFENALKEDNNSSKACTGLGEVLYAAENYDAAKTMYEWGVKNNPDDIAAVEGLAKVNKIFNLPENDNSLFNQDEEKVLVDNSNVDSQSDADKLLNEAYEMFNEKRFTEALDKLSQAEKIFNGHLKNPDDKEFAASFYNMKGFNYLGLNDIEKAKSCFQKALEINPNSSQACAGLGEILYLNKYDEQAKIMFEKAVDYNPENLFAVAGLEKVNKILNSELIEKRNNSNDKLKIFHRDDFGRLFNELKLDGRGAEIGVQRGKYSQILRDTWKGKELYLIDRWEYNSGNNDVANVADDEQKKLYISVVERFIDDSSVQIIRKDSIEASKQFPDGYFDWIYLDADHSYKGCLSDLKAWYPKLKKGGVFAGHDYVDGKLYGGNFKVKSAVDEFINDKEVKLYQTEENTLKSWYFVKPGAVSSAMENTKNKTFMKSTGKEEAKLQSVLNEILEASYELFSLKHYDEAIDSLSKSEELFYSQNDKDLISAYENMKGFNYLGLDDKTNARKCFETALNINPESSQACSGLGELFYLEGRDKEAKTMYEFAVKNNPENPYAVSGLEKVNKILDYPETHNTLLNY